VLDWVDTLRTAGTAVRVVGTDEHAAIPVTRYGLAGPTVVEVGNETAGLSGAWREACDHLVRIPMVGSASSLNAAVAGSIVLYEAARQRAGQARP